MNENARLSRVIRVESVGSCDGTSFVSLVRCGVDTRRDSETLIERIRQSMVEVSERESFFGLL